MSKKLYVIDWRDYALPDIVPAEQSADTGEEPATYAQCRDRIVDTLRWRVESIRESIRYYQSLREKT